MVSFSGLPNIFKSFPKRHISHTCPPYTVLFIYSKIMWVPTCLLLTKIRKPNILNVTCFISTSLSYGYNNNTVCYIIVLEHTNFSRFASSGCYRRSAADVIVFVVLGSILSSVAMRAAVESTELPPLQEQQSWALLQDKQSWALLYFRKSRAQL